MAQPDAVRVIALLRGGHTVQDIAAITGATEAQVVETLRDPEASPALPSAGGGGSSVVHATDLPDQTITLVDAGQPQDLATLWRVEGPGLWTVAIWYEIKPADDNDYAGVTLMGEADGGGGGGGINVGPDARAFMGASEILPGGWIREGATLGAPVVLMPTQWRDYTLTISGFHYHDDDPGDTTTPALGDVQLRNCRVVAIQLGA